MHRSTPEKYPCIDIAAISAATSLKDGATAWIQSGGAIVRLKPLSKTPLGKWKDQIITDPSKLLDWDDANIGLVCGRKTGIAVVDLDTEKQSGIKAGLEIWKALEEGYGAADNGGPCSSTPSNGKHIFYRFTKAFPNSNSLPFIDLKGEGGYVVVSPSATQDGAYSLSGGDSLPPFPHWLSKALNSFKQANVKSAFKLASSMSDGDGRNNHLYETGIKMLRAGIPAPTVAGVLGLLNRLFKSPLEPNEALPTIKSILNSNAAKNVEQFQHAQHDLNEQFVFCTSGNNIYRHENPRVPPMVKGAFLTTMGLAGKQWLSSPRHIVDDIGYYPGKGRIYTDDETGTVLLNQFHFPFHRSDDGDLTGFLDLTENLWDEHSDFILDLLASIVQEPDKRIQIMPLLMGLQGVGKNMWMDYIVAAIGYHNHTRETLENVAGAGNSDWGDWAARSLICVVSEAETTGKEKYTLGPKIRDKITDEFLPVNIKYGANGTQRIFTSLWGFTNLESAVVVPMDDRRFFIHRTDFNITDPDKHQAYFAQRKGETQNPAVAGALFKFLAEREIKQNPYGRAPMTAYKKTLMQIGTNETEGAINHVILNWPVDCITANSLKEIVGRYMGRVPDEAEYKYAVRKVTTINNGEKMRWKGSSPQRIYALRNGAKWTHATVHAIREELLDKESKLYNEYGNNPWPSFSKF